MANKISGYLVTWGGPGKPISDGEFFSPDTDFGGDIIGKELPIKEYPMQKFFHNPNRDLDGNNIGTVKIVRSDNNGLWIEGHLDETKIHPQMINVLRNMQDSGISLNFSPEGWTNMEANKDGSIKHFNIISCSIAATPVAPNTKLSIDTAEE